MTSSQELATSILVSCQQTRFHLAEDNASKEIDVKGLSITIADEKGNAASAPKAKGKTKARSEGLEILSNTELRLKAGTHYALVGRNGTGKSTLLRALADKLVPGVPLTTRFAILQQTAGEDDVSGEGATKPSTKTVLAQVVEGDPYRNQVIRELDALSQGLDSSDPLGPVRALRQVKHERLQEEFFEAQKAAKLRSGARGSEARKTLTAVEKKNEESEELLRQDEATIESNAIEEETKLAVDMQGELQSQLDTMPLTDVEAKARRVLLGLGFKEPQLSQKFTELSGGWRMRCLLAAALTQTSDVLILDEPTNYLDLLGILWLQSYLASLDPDTTLVLVSHDRDFVNASCGETVILRDQGLVYFSGNLAAYEKSVRHEILRKTRMKEAQDKQTAHMERTIANNIKQGKKTGDDAKLKQAKSRQKKLDDRMGMQVSANGGRFKLNRDMAGWHDSMREAIEIPREERGVSMSFPGAPDLRFPGSLLSFENVSFSYRKAPKPVFQDVDMVVHMGDRIGVLGLNGAGKSTLVRLLVDEAKPSMGSITRHLRLKVGYYSQHAVETLKEQGRGDPSLTALSLLLRQPTSSGDAMPEQAARQLLGSLGLPGRTASDTPVAKLSGGQLVRLALAILFLEPPPSFRPG